MAVEIVKVENKAQLRKFIRFPEQLYKGDKYFVPALEGDEWDTFNPKKNGAYEFCDADCFLAYKDGKLVGRVAAILNRKANEDWNRNSVRFGWIDFTNDQEVVNAMLDTVAKWGRERGCDNMRGPWGFTDMDKEGLLVEGFEKLCPFTCLYNYPYYDTLIQNAGLKKDVDWVQRIVNFSPELPPMYKLARVVEKRYGLHMARVKNTHELANKYGMAMFHMYNETFAPLFMFSPLTDKQIRNYLDTYEPILDSKFVAVVLDRNDSPVGFAFCVPSLSKAVKKSHGKLFPFGFLRILKALHRNDTLEALMIGVHPDYQGKGANILLLEYIHQSCVEAGIKHVIINPQLEDNFKAISLFDQYNVEPYMRRRAYTKRI